MPVYYLRSLSENRLDTLSWVDFKAQYGRYEWVVISGITDNWTEGIVDDILSCIYKQMNMLNVTTPFG